jgi:hypothetical protein
VRQPPDCMERIVEGKRYAVKTATLLAHDDYWERANIKRSGRNTFLYRTPNGRYFVVNLNQWQSDRDTLTPVGTVEAIEFYASLPDHVASYEEAFPGTRVEGARYRST